MSLYHTYIASRPKADSVIEGITILSQINQRMKKTVPIFNLHEYSCLAPHTMNNYINKLSCLYIYRTKKLLVRSTCVGPYLIIFIPPANFVCGGYTVFTLSVHASVTLCFLHILKSHGWIFIKPCKHVHICKTNTLNKKVRARGQFY